MLLVRSGLRQLSSILRPQGIVNSIGRRPRCRGWLDAAPSAAAGKAAAGNVVSIHNSSSTGSSGQANSSALCANTGETSPVAAEYAHLLQPQPVGSFQVTAKELAGKGKIRLDAYLAAQLPDASRAKISASIKAGLININGAVVAKPSYTVKSGDSINAALLPPEPCTAIPEDIPLDVVFEDDHLIVINKAPGMVVHLSPGHTTGTLVNALLAHCGLPACDAVPSGSNGSSGSSGGGLFSGQAVLGGMLQDDDDLDEGEDLEADADTTAPVFTTASDAAAAPAAAAAAVSVTAAAPSSKAAYGSSAQQQATSRSSSSRKAKGDAGGDVGRRPASASAGSDSRAAAAPAAGSSAGSNTGIVRPGIVHRLDRGTSGLMVVAKTDFVHAALCQQFKERSVSRIYNSITVGVPNPAAARVATNIVRDPGNRLRMMAVPYGSGRGRTAASNYQTLQVVAGGGAAVVQWKLETGRTHQIRVHAKHVGHPLLGDDMYGPNHAASSRQVVGKRSSLAAAAKAAVEAFGRPALHAKTLGFTHPVTKQRLEFDSEWPEDFRQLYSSLQEWS